MPAPSALHSLSLHVALPICPARRSATRTEPGAAQDPSTPTDTGWCSPARPRGRGRRPPRGRAEEHQPVPVGVEGACAARSEEHTAELLSRGQLLCRLLLEKI